MAEIVATFRKDPDAKLPYTIDWSDWLESAETISASTWTVPSGITKDSDTFGDTSTRIWLTGGTAGTKYTLTNTITVSSGKIDERSICIVAEER